MGYVILSHLSCEAHHLACWYKYTFINLTNQTKLEYIVFLKIPSISGLECSDEMG